uniref:Uncharacterized protein n=1 Tax=Anopheles atroparvus TaxID=41427 RepID=A0AAG5D675_ANOAO
ACTKAACFVLVAVATAAYIPSGHGYTSSKHAVKSAAPEPEQHHHHKEEEHDHFVDYYAPINYKFEYGVKDPHTGDHKTHWEERDGDVVRGAYTILDADGSSRLVEYTADSHHGFNARVGHAHHPEIYGHQQGYGGSYGHGHGYSYSKLSKYN